MPDKPLTVWQLAAAQFGTDHSCGERRADSQTDNRVSTPCGKLITVDGLDACLLHPSQWISYATRFLFFKLALGVHSTAGIPTKSVVFAPELRSSQHGGAGFAQGL